MLLLVTNVMQRLIDREIISKELIDETLQEIVKDVEDDLEKSGKKVIKSEALFEGIKDQLKNGSINN